MTRVERTEGVRGPATKAKLGADTAGEAEIVPYEPVEVEFNNFPPATSKVSTDG